MLISVVCLTPWRREWQKERDRVRINAFIQQSGATLLLYFICTVLRLSVHREECLHYGGTTRTSCSTGVWKRLGIARSVTGVYIYRQKQ